MSEDRVKKTQVTVHLRNKIVQVFNGEDMSFSIDTVGMAPNKGILYVYDDNSTWEPKEIQAAFKSWVSVAYTND